MAENVNWKKEVDELLLNAKTPEEAAATRAFATAIAPYLDDTEMLRTLLGKIQRHLNINSVKVIAERPKFDSLDDLKSRLPKDIEIIDLK
jgi:hypothetical protein